MASINNVITVSLLQSGTLAQRANINTALIVTSQVGVLNTANRYQQYADAKSVAADFGTQSEAHQYAKTFFSQQPNSVNSGGSLNIGYWRAVDENAEASSGVLRGEQLSEAIVVGELQTISDGNLSLDIDGTTQDLNALNFQSVVDFAGIVSILNAAIVGATVTEDDQRLIITSDTTGSTSTLTFATDTGTGTFVGAILNLASGTGAMVIAGADASVIVAETKQDALVEIKKELNFFGYFFIDNPTDTESKNLATWGQANIAMGYDVFDSDSNFNTDPANIVWDIKLSGLTNYRCLFSKSGNRHLAVAYMARAHTVNFSGQNTTITMHLKELRGVLPESYSQTEITAAKNVGLEIYTTTAGTPTLLTSGANEFWDNVYNLIAIIDAVQVDEFNLLKGTATKIGQNQPGLDQTQNTVERTLQGFVNANAIGAGTWTSPDTFGDLGAFNRSIEQRGFYVLMNRLSDQPQSEREARKAPLIQIAIKNVGAFHTIDNIVNFNK